MTRFEDWPKRLDEAIAVARVLPFAWGQRDCLLFAADCVEAMTGTDPAAQWRGRWSSAEEAYAILNAEFGGDLAAAVDSVLGERLGGPAFAQRGDVVMVDTPNGLALGVCAGSYHVAPWRTGLVALRFSQALAAWRI